MASRAARSLERRALRATTILIVAQACALFISAGTLAYWQAWPYLALFTMSTLATDAYLARHDRALLERRLAVDERGEEQGVHKLFFALLRVLMLSLLIVPGLDHRYGWSSVPLSVQVAGFVLLLGGQLLTFLVLRENSYASSVIEVVEQQPVIRSGPYRYVRHPMYTGFLLIGFAAPLCLGSYYGELAMVPTVLLFVMRMFAEERFLSDVLPGYASYLQQTPKRLLPGLW